MGEKRFNYYVREMTSLDLSSSVIIICNMYRNQQLLEMGHINCISACGLHDSQPALEGREFPCAYDADGDD